MFILGGTPFLLIALLLPAGLWQDLMLSFAVTFAAVALIQLTWDFLGGEPAAVPYGNLSLLEDAYDFKLGIQRFWPTRLEWRSDDRHGEHALRREWLPGAKDVRILCSTFSSSWMEDSDFRTQLKTALAQGARVEIVLYHPDSQVLRTKAYDEEESFTSFASMSGMQKEIQAALTHLSDLKRSLAPKGRGKLIVKLTYRFEHFHHIMCIDNRMIVFFYLHGKTGRHSPTMLLNKDGSTLFRAFLSEFDVASSRALEAPLDPSKLVPELPEEATAGGSKTWPLQGPS